MRIKQLSLATGVDVDTIRYYEKESLLPSPTRHENGYRNYGQKELERLSFIRHCRALEISLADIRHLLLTLDTPGKAHPGVDQLVQAQIDRVRARLKSMLALEKQLLLLKATCTGCDKVDEPCGILATLVAAAHGEACACHTRSVH